MDKILKTKDLISIQDLSFQEINEIMILAKSLKEKLRKKVPHRLLEGKILAMILKKPSNRTRISFDVGMFQLGGSTINILPNELGVDSREPLKDVAATLSRYVNGILIRTHDHQEVIDFAKYSSIPVINGLTNLFHPCQALTDVFTIMEYKQSLKDIKFAYVGDGNNVLHSLMLIAAKMGIYLSVACPKEYAPNPDVIKISREESNGKETKIEVTNDPKVAVEEADIVYTDVWVSMGEEADAKEKRKRFEGFQVNKELIKSAKKDCLVMHCLPAHRGEEITEDVLEGENSVVFEQAENRLHVQKAILVKLLK